jgi:hypothetical protein
MFYRKSILRSSTLHDMQNGRDFTRASVLNGGFRLDVAITRRVNSAKFCKSERIARLMVNKGGLHREGRAHGRNVIIKSAGIATRRVCSPTDYRTNW